MKFAHVETTMAFSPQSLKLALMERSRTKAGGDGGGGESLQALPPSPTQTPEFIRQPNLSIPVPLARDIVDLVSSDDELVQKPRSQAIKPTSRRKAAPKTATSDTDSAVSSTSKKRVYSDTLKPPFHLPTSRPVKRQRLREGKVSLDVVNEIDDAALPANFQFIDEYVFRNGTHRLAPEFRTGCSCSPQMGRDVGCEYVQRCECLQDAGLDDNGKRIGFPYHVEGERAGCLQGKYLKRRFAIYECNELCGCGPRCRNIVVQKGRQIPLEIFRTRNRGWGLRAPVNVLKGQFIDTYRGEVITDAEASRRERESAASRAKDSYLFSLDKFAALIGDRSEMYVVDGEFMGGPTRFINHSCDPNCDVFTVSTVSGDAKVYELAIFALDDIPAGTELTFNYIGDREDLVATQDDVEPSTTSRADGAGAGAGVGGCSVGTSPNNRNHRRHQNSNYANVSNDNDDNTNDNENEMDNQNDARLATRCLCGSANCRKYLWL